MAGGNFTSQNKVRPGVYINIGSEPKPVGTIGERGVVTMALPLSFGPSKQVIAVDAQTNFLEVLGYDITQTQMLLIREALKRAKTLLLYRLNDGVKATATVGSLTVTAKYSGSRGNDIKIVIQKNIDDDTKFDVKTLLGSEVVDYQLVANIAGLEGNKFVAFSGSGSLTETAGAQLTSGTDGSVTNQDHSDYLAAIEVHEFNTIALLSTDSPLKSLYTSFVKRLRDDEGAKVQLVVENYPSADYEGVISVKNGVVLSDGTKLTASQAVAWVAGATAAAGVNESLTYQVYDDAVDVDPRYTNAQIETALKNGEFVFTHSNGKAIVEQDINTFTTFTTTKRKHFSKNRVVRVLDGLANDYKRIYEASYIGKVDNNADGRNLFRKECINQAELYQNINAIQDFKSDDVTVLEGEESDGIYVEASIQPVDAIEKIYMKVQVK